jgi:hypothetical protein
MLSVGCPYDAGGGAAAVGPAASPTTAPVPTINVTAQMILFICFMVLLSPC